VETKKLLIRIMKKLDHKNRLLLPKIIMDNIKAKDFYVELYDDESIALVPIKK
jgi:DNA-binding transcriptional regulator/RsmH inhibitor MraZ